MESKRFSGDFLDVAVPDGWMAFYGINSDGGKNPKLIHVVKDAKSEFDIFTRTAVTVCLYKQGELFIDPRPFYSDVVDLGPTEYCGRVWDSFTCTSIGYPYTMLIGHFGENTVYIMILKQNGEYVISPHDSDTMAIIESIRINI